MLIAVVPRPKIQIKIVVVKVLPTLGPHPSVVDVVSSFVSIVIVIRTFVTVLSVLNLAPCDICPVTWSICVPGMPNPPLRILLGKSP